MKKLLFLLALSPFLSIWAQTNPYPLVSIDSIQRVSTQRLAADSTQPDYISPTFQNPTFADTVQIEGLVMFDPHYYGLSRNRKSTFLQTKTGNGWHGVEVMIDTTIFPTGQRPTLSGLNNTTKFYDNFQKGLKVRCTGVVRSFPNSPKTGNTQVMLIDRESEIINLTPDTAEIPVVGIDQLMKNNSGTQIWQPTTGEKFEGVYVELQNIIVVNVSQSGARWNWALQDAAGNRIRVRDQSAFFRNDDNEDIAVPNTFSPPKANTRLDWVRGVIVENVSSGVSEYMLAPLDTMDIGPVATKIPPTIRITGRTPMIPSASDSVLVMATVTDDSSVANVVLNYGIGVNPATWMQINMTSSGTNMWEAKIPEQTAGTFVKYFIGAADSSGNSSVYPDSSGTGFQYQVLNSGIKSIADIQNSPLPNGNSIWAFTRVPMNVRGVVTSTSLTDDLGIVTIQAGTDPYSGIFLRSVTGDGLNGLKRGDSIEITSAYVRETGNATYLDSLKGNYSVISSGNALPAFLTPSIDSILSPAYNKEQWEAMLVKFDAQYIVNVNEDAPSQFGEFGVYPDSSRTKGLRVDDQSRDLGTSFNTDSISLKQSLSFIQGVLTYSFNNWKLWPRNRMDMDMSNQPDKIAPVIVLNGKSPDSLMMGGTYADPGVTATDNKDGNISSKVTRTSNVDSSKVGTYFICYNVKDLAGNAATQICRTVIVYKSASSAVDNTNDLQIEVFPNPAHDRVFIRQQSGAPMAQVQLMDLNGKLIQRYDQVQGQIQLPVLPEGIYLLEVSTSKGKSIHKISVQ